MSGLSLDEIVETLAGLSPAKLAQVKASVEEHTRAIKWVPNPGPQEAAYHSQADELFYGGEAGGGKSQLGLGLAINEHERSVIFREFNEDARGLGEALVAILGSTIGWNAQLLRYRAPGKLIEFAGLPNEKDKQRHKGFAHDLIVFDELPDFFESQYEFIIGWNRTTNPKQRCRVVNTGNPPTRSKGLWVIARWAPWLDERHPDYPAPDGELRYFVRDEHGEHVEVEGRGPHLVGGEQIYARSRTFIRARLADNPDLARTDYDAQLAGLPPELRAAYRGGEFNLSLQDSPYQVIPTEWVRAAQARWNADPKPPPGVPMCSMGVDPAQGGKDRTAIAVRYDYFFPKIFTVPGRQTPLGSDVAGLVTAQRKNEATIVLDMGGGYGGGCFQTLRENGIEAITHKGAESSMRRTKDNKLRLTSKRTEVYWKFREALDPDQPGGSPVALPPDPELLADLTAPTFEVIARGIVILTKVEVTKILGRSPDKGDAVVMAWSAGGHAASHLSEWRADQRLNPNKNPKVDLGPRRR